MIKIIRKSIKDENGQALLLVLVLLLVGGLIITPLMGLMSAGLKAGQTNEKQMAELYAADSGVEDALWQRDSHLEPKGTHPNTRDRLHTPAESHCVRLSSERHRSRLWLFRSPFLDSGRTLRSTRPCTDFSRPSFVYLI